MASEGSGVIVFLSNDQRCDGSQALSRILSEKDVDVRPLIVNEFPKSAIPAYIKGTPTMVDMATETMYEGLDDCLRLVETLVRNQVEMQQQQFAEEPAHPMGTPFHPIEDTLPAKSAQMDFEAAIKARERRSTAVKETAK